MDQIRVSNLRCLVDTNIVEIKPITLLVGANSSGKSSFLRVFPLLRQSTETRTVSGLLLNEGDVNFGFFPDALNRDADPAELKLEFGLTLQPGVYQGSGINRFLVEQLVISCELIYAKRVKDPRYPFLRSVRLTLGNTAPADSIEIIADEEGKITKFAVNDFVADPVAIRLRLRIERGLVPVLIRVLEDKDVDTAMLPEPQEISHFDSLLLQETKFLFHGLTANETRLATLAEIQIGSPTQMLNAAKQITGVSSWHRSVQSWTVETSGFKKVRNLLLAKAAKDILASVNFSVSQLARSIHYFQPVRAGVQRDYLSRDVQVESVDPSGLNVAMVLATLPRSALEKFREWMRSHFGFEVFPQSVGDGARIALRMREEQTGAEFNLADMGFGFSQMLPFLVQMWHLLEYQPSRGRTNRYLPHYRSDIPRSFLFAIEQPELHLHPALQARLADLFVTMVRVSREKNLPMRFVLETHSPTIIERVGQLIESSHLQADDVQILLFERGKDGRPSNTAMIRRSSFTAEGILKDWPFGFLSAPPDPLPPPSTPAQASLTP